MKDWSEDFKYEVDVYETFEHAEIAFLVHCAHVLIKGEGWQDV
jgi:hypothetical protein